MMTVSSPSPDGVLTVTPVTLLKFTGANAVPAAVPEIWLCPAAGLPIVTIGGAARRVELERREVCDGQRGDALEQHRADDRITDVHHAGSGLAGRRCVIARDVTARERQGVARAASLVGDEHRERIGEIDGEGIVALTRDHDGGRSGNRLACHHLARAGDLEVAAGGV